MSNTKIGGEYGAIRASIDVSKLDAFLSVNLLAYKSPLDVQQFKAG